MNYKISIFFVLSCIVLMNAMGSSLMQSNDWTLRALRIQGISFGKQKYYPLYEISHGDTFSFMLHQESIAAIKRTIKTEGYLGVKLYDYFKYYPDEKALDVILTVDKGPLYKIAQVLIIVDPSPLLTHLQLDQLVSFLEHTYTKKIEDKQYTSERIAHTMKEIQHCLEQRGLTSSYVSLSESRSDEDARVKITFIINLEKSRAFEFFGNHYFSSKELMRVVTHFGKDAGMLPAEILAQEVLSEYHKKGFWKADIGTSNEGQKDYFVIQEGPRAKIKEIVLKGVEAFNKVWFEKHFLNALKNKWYDADKEKQALNRLRDWYHEQGFWDIAFLQRKYIPLIDNCYAFKVVIDEGARRFINNVDVVGYPDLTKHALFARINYETRKKIPFAPSLLAEQKAFLTKIFRSRGYLYARIDYTLHQEQDGWKVCWNVLPGQQIKFGTTTIKGYTKVSHKTLLKQLAYKPGDIWSKEKLQNTLVRFRSLDLFERVHLQPVYTKHKDEMRDVVITLQEDDPFEVKMRLGYQQVSKSFAFKRVSSYRAGATCLWRNPLNKADALFFDCAFTRFDRFVSGIYKIPFSLGSPCMSTIKGYTKKYTQPVSVGSKKTLYETNQDGFSMGVSSHGKHFDMGCTVGFEWAKTKNVSTELAAAMRFEADLIDKRIPYFVIQPTLFLDFLDDKLNPTKGIFASVALKGMVPFEKSSYSIKLLAEEGVFIPMGPITFAARARLGHIFRKQFTAIMPPDRFYLGGANSLRGYQTDKCPPLGNFVDEKGATQWVAQGGKSMFNINLELRIPLHKKLMYAVVFQDFGALEEEIHTLMEPKKPLTATGIGLRYSTPIGPLRFDIGWKWHKQFEEETSYAWFLTFGHAF